MPGKLVAIVASRVPMNATRDRDALAMGKLLTEAVRSVVNLIVEKAVIAFSIATIVALFAWPIYSLISQS